MSTLVLEVRNLTISFPGDTSGRILVVKNLNLEVVEGEVLALVGESGCGKTVTALSVLRLLPSDSPIEQGDIQLCGQDILAMSDNELHCIRGHNAAIIFQEPTSSLNPVFTVGYQVASAIRLHEGVSRLEARKRTVELFIRVGIPDPDKRLSDYPHQLSGGLQQRVMIAMALASHPKLLIADEPTTALDMTIQAQILELLRNLQCDLGMAILLITHDFGLVNELADRVAVMYAGTVVEQGTHLEVLSSPRHPYTLALMRAMPSRGRKGERLAEIEGQVPAPGNWPTGCRFAPRCDRVMPICRVVEPDPTHLSLSHTACCHAVAQEENR